MIKLSDKIIQGLKSRKIKPKWQFVRLAVLKDALLIISLILAILAAGIVGYIITHYNPWEYLPGSWRFFIRGLIALPWELIGLLLLLFGIIYYLTKKVHFIYRLNTSVTVLGILLLIFGGYFIAEAIGLNQKISSAPFARQIYQKQGRFLGPERGPMIVGEIKEKSDQKIIVTSPLGKDWEVELTDKTRFPKQIDLKVGDRIQVIGKKNGSTIAAFDIRKIDEDFRGFRKGPQTKGQQDPRFGPRFFR